MKLLSAINLRSLGYAVFILLLSGTSLFFFLKMEIEEEIDEQLTIRAARINVLLDKGEKPNAPFVYVDYTIPGSDLKTTFSDTIIYISEEEEYEIYRKLVYGYSLNGSEIKVEILESRLEWEDLIEGIFWMLVMVSVLLVISSFWINYRISKGIWRPFFNNLERLKIFSVRDDERLLLEDSNIKEFDDLNKALLQMGAQMKKEYDSLKEFTENASHELQTPLSIIISKLDQLDQMELNPESAHRIGSIRNAVSRLSKLNKDLILLTQIDNRQFDIKDTVNTTNIVLTQFDFMKDVFDEENIKYELDLDDDVSVLGHERLLTIMVSNLIANAYKYTSAYGIFRLELDKNGMSFINSGKPLNIESDKIFSRFVKGDASESSGLGLAIVASICEIHKFKLSYRYYGIGHQFKIEF